MAASICNVCLPDLAESLNNMVFTHPNILRFAHAVIAAVALYGTLAHAQDNTLEVNPRAPGPFAVQCSNVAQDASRIPQLGGGNIAEFWEGRPTGNGTPRYITQLLTQSSAAILLNPKIPDDSELYTQTRDKNVEFASVACWPTPRSNANEDYALPEGNSVVPKMLLPGQKPQFISASDYAQGVFGISINPPVNQPAKMPFIIYSHGLGGSPIGKGYIDILRILASHGYIVGAVFHGDARFSKIRVEDVGDVFNFLRDFDKFVELETLRPLSLKALTDWALGNPDYAIAIDPDRIGAFGASMGGQAVTNLMGAKLSVTLGKSCRSTVVDSRIRAAATYVPYMGQSFLPSFCGGQTGADSVDKPFFGMGGTVDSVAPITQAKQAINRFKGSRYFVEVDGLSHELNETVAPDALTWFINFYDAYLRGSPTALAKFRSMKNVAGGGADSVAISATVGPSVKGLWWNANEDGHGFSLDENNNKLFLTWYLYDQAGKAQWIVVPGARWSSDLQEISGDGFIPTGSTFTNYDTTKFAAGASVGTIRLKVKNASTNNINQPVAGFEASYTLNGLSGTKAFTPYKFGAESNAAIPFDGNFTGLWWGGEKQNGWGIMLTQDKKTIFGSWYTYGADGKVSWMTMPGGFWSGNSYIVDVYRASGSAVLGVNYIPANFKPTRVGTMAIEFLDNNTARMTFNVDGIEKTQTIMRFIF